MRELMEDINDIMRQGEHNVVKLNKYKEILEELIHSDGDE